MYPWVPTYPWFFEDCPITDLQTGACSVGAGAYWQGDWCYWNFFSDLSQLSELHINYKECLCIVLAALRWGSQWQNRHVIVFCDNQAAVAMINKGSTASPLMMTYLRLLFWLSASFNFRITAKYLPGKDNCVADCISRLHEPQMMLRWAQWLLHSSIQSPIMHLLHNMSYNMYYLLIQSFTASNSFSLRSSCNRASPGCDSVSICSLCWLLQRLPTELIARSTSLFVSYRGWLSHLFRIWNQIGWKTGGDPL